MIHDPRREDPESDRIPASPLKPLPGWMDHMSRVNEVLDRIYFKNCNKTVQQIINIVVDYTREAE